MKMVKFKMKVWLGVAISLFMTVSMLFYVNFLNYLKPFNASVACLSAFNCQVLYLNEMNGGNEALKIVSFKRLMVNGSNSVVIEDDADTYLVNQNSGQGGDKNESDVGEEFVELVSISKGAPYVNQSNADRFQRRRSHVAKECLRSYEKPTTLKIRKEKLDHIIVDEKNKVLFCYIPKVACTNWKRMLLLMTGKSNNISYVTNLPSSVMHSKNLFASLQNYSVPEVQIFLQSYKKFIFVRNPLERLLSAYRNKLEQHYNSSKYFQSRFGKFIVKNFRSHPSNLSLSKGDDVTFPEFVSYLLSIKKEDYNEHWQTMTDLCYPCFIDYDYIGKYENLMDDSKFILEMFGVNHSFPSVSKPSQTAATLSRYYHLLSEEYISKLYQVYEMDFRLFDYNLTSTLGS